MQSKQEDPTPTKPVHTPPDPDLDKQDPEHNKAQEQLGKVLDRQRDPAAPGSHGPSKTGL